MAKTYDLAMPNDRMGSEYEGNVVVASVWVNDDEGTYLTLELRKSAPYFEVCEYKGAEMTCTHGEFYNIHEAIEVYDDMGGDY